MIRGCTNDKGANLSRLEHCGHVAAINDILVDTAIKKKIEISGRVWRGGGGCSVEHGDDDLKPTIHVPGKKDRGISKEDHIP